MREPIAKIATANPLWGAPRVLGELLKLGITISLQVVFGFVVLAHERRRAVHLK